MRTGVYFLLLAMLSCRRIEGNTTEISCMLNVDCGPDVNLVCHNGVCTRCIACDFEYNRVPGNVIASCPATKTLNCGKCMPNFHQVFNSTDGDDVQPDHSSFKCTLELTASSTEATNHRNSSESSERGTNSSSNYVFKESTSSDTSVQKTNLETVNMEDRDAPWIYIGLIGAFLLAFSGVGTWISWKYQPIILKMKKHRQRITIKYRQKSEDIRNASVKEKEKMSQKEQHSPDNNFR